MKSVWVNDSLRLQVAQFEDNGDGAELVSELEAMLDDSALQQQADSSEWPFDELIIKWKVSLTTAGDYVYEIIDNHLQWYKNDVIRVKYGSIRLTNAEPKFKLCTNLLLDSISQQNILAAEYKAKSVELKSKEQHSADMKAVYEQYVNQRNAEQELRLVQFAALLNEKKARLKQLEKASGEDHSNGANLPHSEDFEINSTPNDYVEMTKRSRSEDAKPSTSHQRSDAIDDIYNDDTQELVDSNDL